MPDNSSRLGRALFALLTSAMPAAASGQTVVHYEPTLKSLDTHPLPKWYADAKLGIFIHYGLYSVPGWAPLTHPTHDYTTRDYIKYNPYAEWYYNTMRVPGSPTQAYHREHYGANYDYYNFIDAFNKANLRWKAAQWAAIFRAAGARYVVLTTKHHEGFTLWPSAVPNPKLPLQRRNAARDIVGELTAAVRTDGMHMGLYYSGGYDWTFVPGPIVTSADYEKVKPESAAYGAYADAQIRELIRKYHPSVLWNDIDWPKSGHALQVMAYYYNTVPDGVVDDRFGVPHSDFTSPEYSKLDKIASKKWEECRGLGQSFGYNRAEGEAETIASNDLIYLLADIVSKNGNLLLDVGPEADGTIPPVQMERLRDLGAWLRQNGDAIYGTVPWSRAEGTTAQGVGVRFTRKGNHLYAILLGAPKGGEVTIKNLAAQPGSQIRLLGLSHPMHWSADGANLKVTLPASLPGKFAYVLELRPAES